MSYFNYEPFRVNDGTGTVYLNISDQIYLDATPTSKYTYWGIGGLKGKFKKIRSYEEKKRNQWMFPAIRRFEGTVFQDGEEVEVLGYLSRVSSNNQEYLMLSDSGQGILTIRKVDRTKQLYGGNKHTIMLYLLIGLFTLSLGVWAIIQNLLAGFGGYFAIILIMAGLLIYGSIYYIFFIKR